VATKLRTQLAPACVRPGTRNVLSGLRSHVYDKLERGHLVVGQVVAVSVGFLHTLYHAIVCHVSKGGDLSVWIVGEYSNGSTTLEHNLLLL
jgi:hypothetical protein